MIDPNKPADDGSTDIGLNRRRVLQAIGAGAGLAAFGGGNAAAQSSSAPQRYNVGIEPSDEAAQAVQAEATSVHRELDFDNIGKVISGQFPDRALDALAARNDVRYVEKDGQYQALAQTLPWGIDRINAEVLHNEGRTGAGASIAIIDTGIDSDHPDLQGNLGPGHSPVNCDSGGTGSCNKTWDDDNGHGTHVAGTANATNNNQGVVGVSTEATLHAVKVLDENGSGPFSDVAAGLRTAADEGYDVANMSLGGGYSDTVADATLYAYRKGLLMVASAGNDGFRPPCNDGDCVSYPAKFQTVIAVSALEKDDDLAGFSSLGPEVELIAPGGGDADENGSIEPSEAILSTWNDGGYNRINGTSMASPHVAGVAGQLAALGFEHDIARKQLRQTADSVGLAENEQGYGLVDADGAVPAPLGEAGTVQVDASDGNDWNSVSFQNSYSSPSPIMGPVSFNGSQPCHVRMRNVTSTGFEFKLEEWPYENGAHIQETIHWVVLERGTHTLGDGTRLGAGYLGGQDHNFTSITWGPTFDSKPVEITAVQSYNGVDPVVSRQRNIDRSGSDWKVQEEKETGPEHGNSERIGTFQMIPGSTNDLYGTKFEVGRKFGVNHTWHTIDFDQLYKNPIFIASIQTNNGAQPAGLRYRNLSSDSVEVFVEEEQSGDDETRHNDEQVGYMVVESSAEAFGSEVNSRDVGTFYGLTEYSSDEEATNSIPGMSTD